MMTVMIEPDDYEMTKHIAIFVLGGSSEDDLKKMGYLETDESRRCYTAALERPNYWANLELESSGAGCMPSLGDEWLEDNKDWFKPR